VSGFFFYNHREYMSGFLTRINLLTTESGFVGTCSSFLSLIVRVM